MEFSIGIPNDCHTYQNEFPLMTKCQKCGKEARFAITILDDYGEICQLHDNMANNKFWPHDACAISIYFCVDVKCATTTVLWNQA